MFDGGYHGGVLYFGHGSIPINLPLDWVMAPYNDVEGTLDLIRQPRHRSLLPFWSSRCWGAAAVLPARKRFPGRPPPGGQRTRHHPDLRRGDDLAPLLGRPAGGRRRDTDAWTLGKYLGGGSSFGAFGGRAGIMGHVRSREARLLAPCRYLQQQCPFHGGRPHGPARRLHAGAAMALNAKATACATA